MVAILRIAKVFKLFARKALIIKLRYMVTFFA